MLSAESPLPRLRPDVVVFPGPRARGGSPTFTVYDPMARTYDKIGWAEAEILSRLHRACRPGELLAAINRTTTIRITREELFEFCRLLQHKGLTVDRLVRPVQELLQETSGRKIFPLTWLLHHYLYFRIPLFRSDTFLEKVLPYAKVLTSQVAIVVNCIILSLGMLMLLERPEVYLSTFTYFFNWKGVLSYGLALVAIKAVHEFSHALTAKSYEVRVPVMGVAFIVLWPVAYCDVTDAWRLASREKRFLIGFAGVGAEIVIAAWSLFFWGLTSPGIANTVFFVFSSVSLLSTLAINVNPAMRFDGYFMLMDLWGVDNLQPRAFAYTKWLMRRKLFGLETAPPEPEATVRFGAALTVYSVYAWMYRLLLYVGMAVFIYHQFTKVVGIVLFITEIGWFIVRPIYREMKILIKNREHMKVQRSVVFALPAIAFILWGSVPLPHRFSVPAVTLPRKTQIIYAPHSGMIVDISTGRDQPVDAGDLLCRIESYEIKADLARLTLEKQIVEKERNSIMVDSAQKALLHEKDAEIIAIVAEQTKMMEIQRQNTILAGISGTMVRWDEHVRNGCYVRKDQVLGEIFESKAGEDDYVVAFINEKAAGDFITDKQVYFVSDADPRRYYGRMRRISPVRADKLDYAVLASLFSGDLPVIRDAQTEEYMLRESYYPVDVDIPSSKLGNSLRLGQSGRLWVWSRPRSYLYEIIKNLYRTGVRESGF